MLDNMDLTEWWVVESVKGDEVLNATWKGRTDQSDHVSYTCDDCQNELDLVKGKFVEHKETPNG